MKAAIEAYRTGKLSLGAAAEMAGVSTWEFMDALRAARIPMPLGYGWAEAFEDVEQQTDDGSDAQRA